MSYVVKKCRACGQEHERLATECQACFHALALWCMRCRNWLVDETCRACEDRGSRRWYVARNGETKGPFRVPELQQLATSGQLLPTDLIWKEGLASWVPASRAAGLFTAQAPPQVADTEIPFALGPWPWASHFSMMLQNPRIAFRRAELRQITVTRDRLNQPRAWSGAFATVFQARFPSRRRALAIRVFTNAAPERRARYQAIADYLRNRTIAPLVAFDYDDDGIRSASDGKFYPLVTMDWVFGETLFEWVGRKCRSRDRLALSYIAARWTDLVDAMARADVSHGNLTHDNVIVSRRGLLKLVDYDSMCVPALVGKKSLEVSIEPYRHPARAYGTPLSLASDNYSAIVVLIALRALAAAPELWAKFVDLPNRDAFLFRRQDMEEPHRSELIAEIRRSPDQAVPRLLQTLIDCRHRPPDRVPQLSDLMSRTSSPA